MRPTLPASLRSPSRAAAFGWPLLLAVATLAGSLIAACLMPLAALATLAAATLPRSRGIWTIAAIWAANQALGFTLLGYPHDAHAVAGGLALLAGSLSAFATARTAGAATGRPARLTLAFVLAFAAYEAVLFAASLLIGGGETFTLPVIAQVGLAEAIWFAGLVGLSGLAQRAAPRLAPHVPALRLA